jgi:hypothetical protein
MVINEEPITASGFESDAEIAKYAHRLAEVEQRHSDATAFMERLSVALEGSGEGVCERTALEIPGVHELTYRGVAFTLWWDSGWKYRVAGIEASVRGLESLYIPGIVAVMVRATNS